MEALDLRRRPPRGCYEELDGLMLMPRTIDKLRAKLPGGEPGEYVINLNEGVRGISGFLLERLGIREGDLLEAVHEAASDADVAAWLRERVDVSQYPAINATLRRIKPKHADDPAVFNELYSETLQSNPNLEFIIDIVEADDRRMWGDQRSSNIVTPPPPSSSLP